MPNFDAISDLHLDMRPNATRLLMDIEPGSETLVIAGDLCEARNLKPEWIQVLLEKYSVVLYVPGNHEYYGLTKNETHDKLYSMMLGNAYILQESAISLRTGTFAGATLWFPDAPDNWQYEHMISDFRYIHDFSSWVYEDHNTAKRWLSSLVGMDVWITHHLPLWKSVHPKYEGDTLNRFFVGDLSKELRAMAEPPKVIVHGHTHEECDYMAGDTRVVCNPLGYPNEGRRSIIPVTVAI